MIAYVHLTVEIQYDNSGLEAEVDSYAYELANQLRFNFPTPVAGITVEDVHVNPTAFE